MANKKKKTADLNYLFGKILFARVIFQDYLILRYPLLKTLNIYDPSYFAVFDFISVDACTEDFKKLKHLILLNDLKQHIQQMVKQV